LAGPQKLSGDYHLFVPLLDQNGRAVTQVDIVRALELSTASWSAAQHWTESVTLNLPKD